MGTAVDKESIDDELRVIAKRREEHTDLLVRALVAIDACDDRTQVLLDRRNTVTR